MSNATIRSSRPVRALRAMVAEDDRNLERGWRLSGPGDARFGWWLVTAAGDASWLGSTAWDALSKLGDL